MSHPFTEPYMLREYYDQLKNSGLMYEQFPTFTGEYEEDMKILEKIMGKQFREQAMTISQNMIQYGGSFVKSLGHALAHADEDNTIRIARAFPEYWEEYFVNFRSPPTQD